MIPPHCARPHGAETTHPRWDSSGMTAMPPDRDWIGVRSRSVLGRVLEPEGSERFARWAVAVAIVAYAASALWLTRGASFTLDELSYLGASDGFAPGKIAEPFGGHLTALTRLFFEASLRLFGPAHLPFQVLVIVLTAATAAAVFVLVKRRIGPLAALAPAIMLLFLASTPEVIQGSATMWVQASAAGLAAFLALDEDRRAPDVLACGLLLVAVLSFEVGVAFALGAGAWVLADRDWRRLWIALIPLALYGAWWVWALKFDVERATLDNILLIPAYSADSLAAASAALAGLGVDLSNETNLSVIAIDWGRLVAVTGVAMVAIGIRRSGSSQLLWGATGFLVGMWISLTLSFGLFTSPASSRFAYPVAIGLVLVLAASFRGWPPSRRVLLVVLGMLAFALPANLWLMNERGSFIRATSDRVRATLAIIELQRDLVPAGYGANFDLPIRADDFLAAVDRFGTFAYSMEELATAPADVRQTADETLGGILSPDIASFDGKRSQCSGGANEVELPPGGAVLRAKEGGTVSLRRFADSPTIEVGALAPGQVGRLALPLDGASRPWVASISAGTLEVCAASSVAGPVTTPEAGAASVGQHRGN